MAWTNPEWPFQIGIMQEGGKNVLDPSGRKLTSLETINAETFVQWFENMKLALAPERRAEADAAIQSKLSSYTWKIYNPEFTTVIWSLNKAFLEAKAWSIDNLVRQLWLWNITPEWIARVKASLSNPVLPATENTTPLQTPVAWDPPKKNNWPLGLGNITAYAKRSQEVK